MVVEKEDKHIELQATDVQFDPVCVSHDTACLGEINHFSG
jgi:hypothetical protein